MAATSVLRPTHKRNERMMALHLHFNKQNVSIQKAELGVLHDVHVAVYCVTSQDSISFHTMMYIKQHQISMYSHANLYIYCYITVLLLYIISTVVMPVQSFNFTILSLFLKGAFSFQDRPICLIYFYNHPESLLG